MRKGLREQHCSVFQELMLISRDERGEIQRRTLFGVRFVPMRGEAEER